MNRITSDDVFSMNMHELALNQVYIAKDGWAWYRKAPDEECSVCDLVRDAAQTLGVELPILSDDELCDLLTDFLQYGEEEPEGVLAILFRALCALAEVRASLKRYEDTGLEPEEITGLQRAWDMYGGEEGITAILEAHEAVCEELTECRMLREKHAPPCYSPDIGGECRYQIYSDYNDEPIDKCKRCPLCYADKCRHQQEPNTPLTLEELREMDGEPVYIHFIGCAQHLASGWAFVCTAWEGCKMANGAAAFFSRNGETWLAYRRKPEEGTTPQEGPAIPSWAEHLKRRFERQEGTL